MLETQFSPTPAQRQTVASGQRLEKSRFEISVFLHWCKNMNVDTVKMRRFTLRFADAEEISNG